MKLEFFLKKFEKYPYIHFHEHLSNGSRVIRCRQTGRSYSLFSQFCQRPEATCRRHAPLVHKQHRAATPPLQIMLFCKHLPATQPTRLSVGTLGTFVHRSRQTQELGTPRVQSRLLWKANTRIACKKASSNAPSHIFFLLYSVTNASNKIHFSKHMQRFNSVHHSDHRLLRLQSFRPSSVYTAQHVMFSRDCRLIHNINYNLHYLQLTSQMFVFRYVPLLYYRYRVSFPWGKADGAWRWLPNGI